MWLIVLIISPLIFWADIKLFKFYYKVIFREKGEFNNSKNYGFTTDILSLFREKDMEDNFAELKLSICIMLCVGTIALEVLFVKFFFL